MMRVFIAGLFTLLAVSCGGNITPNAGLWGVPIRYAQGTVPGDLAGQAVHGRDGVCHVTVTRVEAWLLAHEATHCYAERYGVPAEWTGAACWIQEDARCTAEEAWADAVAHAAQDTDCTPGDLGWPGQLPSGCELPHPAKIHPK